jgi:hypothetical protein
MMYNTPQFIDVEDKIAGPLTWRQLGWMIGMGVSVFLIWATVGGVFAFVLGIPVVLIFVALAFYRPNGQPMIGFAIHGFFFLFRPKVILWDRPTGGAAFGKTPARKSTHSAAPKTLGAEEIRRIAGMVDGR